MSFRHSTPRYMSAPTLQMITLLMSVSLLCAACEEARRTPLMSSSGAQEGGGAATGGVMGGVMGGALVGGALVGGEEGGAPSPDLGPPPAPPYESLSPKLKLKNPQQLQAHLAQVLSLPPSALCQELGRFDCLEVVHGVTLGGVSAYQRGLYRPLEQSSITSPIALERVVYAACGERVRRDAAPQAAGDAPGDEQGLFRELFSLANAQGELSQLNDPIVERSLQTLYQRAYLREASEAELSALKGYYQTLEAEGQPLLVYAWAWGVCHATLTSLEMALY